MKKKVPVLNKKPALAKKLAKQAAKKKAAKNKSITFSESGYAWLPGPSKKVPLAKQAAERAAMEKADAAERGVITVGIDSVLDCSPQTFIKGLYALLDRRYAARVHFHIAGGDR